MTTIAFKAGVMACDSCWSVDGLQTTSQIKINRLSGGALLGQAGEGDVRSILALLEKVKTPRQIPSRKELAETRTDFSGLLVLPGGKTFQIAVYAESDEGANWNAQVWEVGRKGIAAVGSGSHLAVGAMSAGKSAREAVAIACDWDRNSRGPVHTVALKRATS